MSETSPGSLFFLDVSLILRAASLIIKADVEHQKCLLFRAFWLVPASDSPNLGILPVFSPCYAAETSLHVTAHTTTQS
jgi:hypothetical protein